MPISRPSCITAAMTSVIGISTPCARASSQTDCEDFTPSAVCVVLASTSSSGIPRPSLSPKARLRDSGELQVRDQVAQPGQARRRCAGRRRAPRPAWLISASPRVISMALVLSPRPIPIAIPTASAITFLTAPPSSQPITSWLVYGRK